MMATAKSANGRVAKAAATTFEQVTSGSNEKVKEQMDKATAALSEAAAFGKENYEALVASATAAQKGYEALSARTMAFTKSAIENHMAATKSLMTSKSVQEFVEKQSDYAKSSFEAYVAELNSLSDIMTGIAKDAIKPISERATAVGSMVKTAAAR
ncbi:MAG: phasin family protein [Caulobacterales bacterium]